MSRAILAVLLAILSSGGPRAQPAPAPGSGRKDGVVFDPALVEGEVTRATDLRAPFLARFSRGDLRLWYVGALHESSRRSGTMALIRRVFDERPRFLVIEGVDNAMSEDDKLRYLAYAKRSCDERACPAGEPAFAALSADERHIPFAGGEPSDDRIAADLAKLGFSARDLFAFFFLRQLPQDRVEGRLEEKRLPELYRETFRNHPILKPADFPYEAFKLWYREKNGKPFDLAGFDVDELAPVSAGRFFTQRISAAIDVTRNRFVVRLLAEKLDAHRRVAIVYGASHFLMEQAALEQELGKAVVEK